MQKRCVWIVGHDSPRFDDERVEFYKKKSFNIRKYATVFTTLGSSTSQKCVSCCERTKVGIGRGLRLRGLERQQDICRRLPLILLHYTGSSPPI